MPDFTWFTHARFGLFIHWGPYALYGRGEQVLMRELNDQVTYAAAACSWNPRRFDARQWARAARQAGFRYAVLTTRHHDGYCLWDSRQTDYSSAKQAAGRDFVREFVDAFRAEGLRVGLYYSWNDFRIPSYFAGPVADPEGWARFRDYVHAQVEELLTGYGRIDLFWFDGTWPWNAADWRSPELVERMRALQPHLLINNRLGERPGGKRINHSSPLAFAEAGVNESEDYGDFGTPEHHITPDPVRPWEACQVANWRLWGWSEGERWRSAEVLLDCLVEAASKGGNYLLNVGPTADGELPAPFLARIQEIGTWMDRHGEAIYGCERGPEWCETVLFGRHTQRGSTLYLIVRFWPRRGELRLQGLANDPERVTLLTTGQTLPWRRDDDRSLTVHDLPLESPTPLFPVIKVECRGPLRSLPTYHPGMWGGDPARLISWARVRGTSVWADGRER